MKESIKTAKSVDQALKEACAELGVELGGDNVKYEIIDSFKKGILGFGGHPAKVRVWIEEPSPAAAPAPKAPAAAPKAAPKAAPAAPKAAPAAPKAPAAPAAAEAPAPAPKAEEDAEPKAPANYGQKKEAALAYIKEVLSAMGARDFSVEAQQNGEDLSVSLQGEDLGFVIGRRGETIDAIQYLCGLVVNRMEGDYLRITIDSGNFREKREKTLENLARRLAKNAVRSGRSVTLEPMNPYERRIIHSVVATVEGATSSSIGEEPNRRVVISSLNPKKPAYHGSREGNRGGRRGGRGYDRGEGAQGRGDRSRRGGRSYDRPARPINNEVDTTPVNDVLPEDAESKPLYTKIEL